MIRKISPAAVVMIVVGALLAICLVPPLIIMALTSGDEAQQEVECLQRAGVTNIVSVNTFGYVVTVNLPQPNGTTTQDSFYYRKPTPTTCEKPVELD